MQNGTFEDHTGHGASTSPDVVTFTDSHGRIWRVSERERLSYDRRSIRMLIFESDMAIRCVRTYPDDWRRLEPEALEYLSWKT